MVDGAQVVGEFGPPEESCGGGQGSACDLPVSGIVAPSSPADVIKKSLRVDMLRSPESARAMRWARVRYHAHYIDVIAYRPCRQATTATALQQPHAQAALLLALSMCVACHL